jgi:hypothetical protein
MTSNAKLAQLTLLRDIRRRELDVLDARLDEARRAKAEADAIWHAGIPRPLVPLVATLIFVLAANAALLTGFGIILAECREPFLNAFFTLMALVAVVALPFSGGSWLRRAGLLFLALSFAEVLYAAYTLT